MRINNNKITNYFNKQDEAKERSTGVNILQLLTPKPISKNLGQSRGKLSQKAYKPARAKISHSIVNLFDKRCVAYSSQSQTEEGKPCGPQGDQTSFQEEPNT